MSGWAKDRQTSQNADPVLKSKSTFEDAKTRRITKTWLRFCCSLFIGVHRFHSHSGFLSCASRCSFALLQETFR